MKKFDELDKLIQAYLDQRISDAELQKLNCHLIQSDAARKRYWEMATLHWRLDERAHLLEGFTMSQRLLMLIRESDADEEIYAHLSSEESEMHDEALLATAEDFNRHLSHLRRRKRRALRRQARGLPWLAMAACIGFLLGGLVIAMVMRQTPQPTPELVAKKVDLPPLPVAEILVSNRLEVDYSVSGNELIRNEQRIPLETGMLIEPGDRIITSPNSTLVQLSFAGEATAIKLEPDTQLIYTEVNHAKRLELITGQLRCEVAKQPIDTPMTLVSRYATAEVLGTEFSFGLSGEKAILNVTEGRVRLENTAGTQSEVVRAGFIGKVNSLGELQLSAAGEEEVHLVITDPQSVREDMPAFTPIVTKFALVDANTAEVIPGYEKLENGTVIKLSELPTLEFTVEAKTDPVVIDEVAFYFRKVDKDGLLHEPAASGRRRVGGLKEEFFPYYVTGDITSTGDIHPLVPDIGKYIIKATPKGRVDRRKVVGPTVEITLFIQP